MLLPGLARGESAAGQGSEGSCGHRACVSPRWSLDMVSDFSSPSPSPSASTGDVFLEVKIAACSPAALFYRHFLISSNKTSGSAILTVSAAKEVYPSDFRTHLRASGATCNFIYHLQIMLHQKQSCVCIPVIVLRRRQIKNNYWIITNPPDACYWLASGKGIQSYKLFNISALKQLSETLFSVSAPWFHKFIKHRAKGFPVQKILVLEFSSSC